MIELETQEMTEEFFRCWRAAAFHLNSQIDGGIRSWLRLESSPPFLEHFSFRIGNQLFFVRVEDADGDVRGPGTLQGLETICLGAGGYGCALPMRRNLAGEWLADQPGWGLVEAWTRTLLDPFALVTDEKIEMTDWEVHYMAVQVVRDELTKAGYHLISWQSNPDVEPSIWVVGESGEPEWIIVRGARFPATEAARPSNWQEIAESCARLGDTGHFAWVSLASADQDIESADAQPIPLWRGHAMNVEFSGLI